MNHRTEILPGVYLTAVQSDKFKTGCFSLNLLRPMKKEEAAANALIPSVLLRGSETCPDIASISAKLDELYGASVGTLVRKKGEVQLVGFYCDYVQDEYVDEPVFAPLMAFLAELLLNPRLENGAFPEAVVDSEKLNLENAMLSRINDKRTYAASQLIRTMCAGQPYGIPRIGEPEDLKNITAKSLYAHYRREKLPQYCFEAKIRDKDALVRDELEFVLGGKDADLIYKHLNREAYAEDVLKQYGAELTPYGMVNRADFGPLHEPIPEQKQEQTQEPQMGM